MHLRLSACRAAGAIVLACTALPLGAQQPKAPARSVAAARPARVATAADPREGLPGGWKDAGAALTNLRLVVHRDRPAAFVDTTDLGSFFYANSDLAFQGNLIFQGNFHGIQVWDIRNPGNPVLRTTIECPGGQGDPSVYGNLLFMSVEMPNGRTDCGTKAPTDSVSAERFRGVRIFDISDLDHPKQVAALQTCRGSHTHTLVPDPADKGVVYVYVSGTSFVRSPNELAGCSGKAPTDDPNTSLFRIEVIRVPLAAPQEAKIIGAPRLFAAKSGDIAGLNKGGSQGEGAQAVAQTDQCHDITVYPEQGLALGACAGNGLLIDIRDPANPVRVAEVSDPNFAYWHSATFNNDASSVVFTDEWGGGVGAKCRAGDPPKWGADAIYRRKGTTLTPAGFFKLPAVQTDAENCVAHNGSLIPIPGRDVMVQGWYQGGLSVVDFTDPSHPTEIASFDRGPVNPSKLLLGGMWSAYWYNGFIVGSEIARGLDLLELTPSAALTQNEIDAAKTVKLPRLNVQWQQRIEWPATFVLARAYLDQLARGQGLDAASTAAARRTLAKAELQEGAARSQALTALAASLEAKGKTAKDAAKVKLLAGVVKALAAS